ncbi:hypothetical protein B0H13DRAFT_2362300 [Mycena leptocephala]|nr:hypothetical protein B0H13DRAFT_2362300 [Mycena leptocephala]
MPKVEGVSVWLRWAVDPASALRMLLLLALPTHSSPPSSPSCGSPFPRSRQLLHTLLPPLPPHTCPGAPLRSARSAYSPPPPPLRAQAPHAALLARQALRGGCLDCASEARAVGAQFFPAAPRSFQNPAPPSFLQPRVLLSSAYARTCVDWRVEYGESVGRQSLTCQVADSLRSWDRAVVDSRRAIPIRVPYFYGRASFLGCFQTEPNCNTSACKEKALRWALFSSTLNWVPRCGCEASKWARFTSPGHVCAQRAADRSRYWYRHPFLRLRR